MRDEELIRRAAEGRPGAFEELYYAFVDRVQRQVFVMLGPDSDIDDLIQTTFVQVHRRLGSFRFDASFGTWLHRVTANVVLEHLRKRKRRAEVGGDELALALTEIARDGEPPDAIADRNERLRLLYRILNALKPEKRIVFSLYEIEGHTLEEIAAILGASINTVAARLRAARSEVRRSMERRLVERPALRLA